MSIVNGQYIQDTLPSNFTDQSVTGIQPSKKDWSDSKTAQYNYLLKQQENAYNLQLWNLANEYNSPAAQMQRYQDAGLNPNLVYSQQNTTSPLSAAQTQAFRSQGTRAKQVQNQLATIAEIEGLVKSAADTYDYIKFGRVASSFGAQTAGNTFLKSQADAGVARYNELWNQYLMTGEGPFVGSPRATTYKYQQDLAQQNYERVKFMVASLLPEQANRQRALTELDKYQLEFMQGKYDAVLDIDLGLGAKVNQWARMLMFIALAQMM